MKSDFMRFTSLDMFRGLAIVLMLFINSVSFLSSNLPIFLQHNTSGMLPADIIAPMFQFILGAALVISVNKRKKKGEKTFGYVMKRAFLLLVIGLLLDLSTTEFQEFKWGILQSLGVGLVVGYLFLFWPVRMRAVAAFAILMTYSALITYVPLIYDNVVGSIHSGPIGAISYATVTIFGTIAGTMFYDRREKPGIGLIFGIGLVALSIAASMIIPFNKILASSSYMLFSAGVCFILISFVYIVGEIKKRNISVISMFGRNSLSLWILQYLLMYIPLVYLVGGCCYLPAYLGIAAAFVAFPVYYVIADILDWKGIRIPI